MNMSNIKFFYCLAEFGLNMLKEMTVEVIVEVIVGVTVTEGEDGIEGITGIEILGEGKLIIFMCKVIKLNSQIEFLKLDSL